MHEGLHRSIDTLQWQLEAYDNKLWSVLNGWEACSKLFKQLEAALADVLSTNKECQNLSLVCSVVGRHLGCPRCTVIGTQCV